MFDIGSKHQQILARTHKIQNTFNFEKGTLHSHLLSNFLFVMRLWKSQDSVEEKRITIFISIFSIIIIFSAIGNDGFHKIMILSIFSDYYFFAILFRIVPSALILIETTVIFTFHNFFNSLAKSRNFPLFNLFQFQFNFVFLLEWCHPLFNCSFFLCLV